MPVRPQACPAAATRLAAYSALGVLLFLVPASGCSNRGGAPVTPPVKPVPVLAVQAVDPAPGATAVDRQRVPAVTFAEPVSSLSDEITIEDGAGAMASYLEPNLDGTTWRVHPVRPLPYGATVRVRVRAGTRAISGAVLPTDAVAAFTVVDSAVGMQVHQGPGELSFLRALLWTNGLGGIVNGDTLVRTDVPNAFGMPVFGDVVAVAQDQIGAIVGLTRQGLSPFLIGGFRGDFNGVLGDTVALAPAAFGRCELTVNARGDAVAYCTGTLANGVYESLWAQRPGVSGWTPVQLAPGGTFPLRRLAIDGFGNPFVLWLDDGTGRLKLQRTDLQALPAAMFDVAGLPMDYQVAAQGNGDCRVFWHDRLQQNGQDVHVRYQRRYTYEQGLGPLVELTRGEAFVDRAFASCDTGAAVVVFERPAHGEVFLQRFEASGAVGAPVAIGASGLPLVHALAMSQRGYAVLAFVAEDPVHGDRVNVVVSRPGEAAVSARVAYSVGVETAHVRKVGAAIDDLGRVLVAVVEEGPQSPLALYSVSLQ